MFVLRPPELTKGTRQAGKLTHTKFEHRIVINVERSLYALVSLHMFAGMPFFRRSADFRFVWRCRRKKNKKKKIEEQKI